MDYLELHLRICPTTEGNRDIVVAQLADLGYDSFMDAPDGLLAYKGIKPTETRAKGDLDEQTYSANKNGTIFDVNEDITQIAIPQGVTLQPSTKIIADQNWNAVWESNFEPIEVAGRCKVRASFHKPSPGVDYDIVIDPKMSFGTGHHATTHLMIEALLNIDLEGKHVLDMGCGTGVLAILAEKRGAASVVAIDNDEWAYQNTLENLRTNGCTRITAKMGNAALLQGQRCDVLLANINLNTLMDDMKKYVNCLNPNSLLIISGILESDIPTMEKFCQAPEINLKLRNSAVNKGWARLELTKT